MNFGKKISDLFRNVHSSSPPKPDLVKICRNDGDVEKARQEFAESDGRYERLILIRHKNASVPKD